MKRILIIATAALLFSCDDHHQHGDDTGLTLNEGKKWTVNSETHEGMTHLQQLLSTEINMDSIGFKMADETTYIINNCDMKGEAHDQLHLVLHPILSDIETLKKSDDKAERQKAIAHARQMLSDYFTHFTTE